MKKYGLILIILFFLYSQSFAADFSHFRRLGARFGLWNGTEIEKKKTSPTFEILIIEGMRKGISLEFSFGVISRGETRIDIPETGEYYWESVNIYPISGSGVYHFFSGKEQNILFPYLKAGASLVIGTRVIETGLLSPLNPLYWDSGTKTEVTFGLLGGVGLDLKLSRSLVGNFDTKYRFIKFGDEIGQNKDYSGIEFGLGISYIWGIKK